MLFIPGEQGACSCVLGKCSKAAAELDTIHDVYGHNKPVIAIINVMQCEWNRVTVTVKLVYNHNWILVPVVHI